MGYKNKADEDFENMRSYRKPIFNRLTTEELQAMDMDMENYRVEKEVKYPIPMKITIYNEKQWLIDKGGLSKDGAVKIEDYKPAKYNHEGTKLLEPCDSKPILWEQLQSDLNQWNFWKGRKELSERKKIEGLQELYNQIHVPREKSDDWERKQKFLGKDITQVAVDNF